MLRILLFSILTGIFLSVNAQNIPFYGNITPADSTGYDLGRTDLRWDTVFYNVLIPAITSAADSLAISNDTLSIIGSNSVVLPAASPDSLAISNDTLSIIGSNSVVLPAAAPDSLSISNDTLSIIGSNSIVLPTPPDSSLWHYTGGFLQPKADTPFQVISNGLDTYAGISISDSNITTIAVDSTSNLTSYIALGQDATEELIIFRDSTGTDSDNQILFGTNGMIISASKKIDFNVLDSIFIIDALPVDSTGLPLNAIWIDGDVLKVKQ